MINYLTLISHSIENLCESKIIENISHLSTALAIDLIVFHS